MKKLKAFSPLLLVLSLFIFALSGCGSSKASSQNNGELNFIGWSEYIPPKVIHNFEKKYHIKVNMTTYSSPEDMSAKVQSSAKGTYDMLLAPGMFAASFKKIGLLDKINKAKIPNFKNLGKAYISQGYDPDNHYSVPYLGTITSIVVNKSKIKDDIDSYQDLLNPKYRKQMVVVDDQRAVIGAALMANGYDINATSAKALNAAKNYLTKLRPNIKIFDGDSPKTELMNGEASLGLVYGGEIALAMDKNPNIKVIYPKNQGVYFEADTFMKFKGAKNPAAVEKFMNYILDPKVITQCLKEFPYVNPNKAALKYLPKSYLNNPAKNVPQSIMKKTETVQDIGKATTKYDKIWNNFKTQK
ncbi:MAG: spermidine/putrescine ABC transporter substrate-binding protein [Sporolactobacillus sp.]|jgi:spermidine/putrescine-binding protein|nr:spermidine/putrescine ABC transporter substrate-binding protein [Sporolactobacillus sp.]